MKNRIQKVILLGLIQLLASSTNCFSNEQKPPERKLSAQSVSASNFSPVASLKSYYVDPYTGSANFSIPLFMPPARKTLPCKLNLVYSSRAINGWLGVGWKLDLGLIERSTKNGLPKYDSSDTFVFSLGEQQNDLVYVGRNEYRPKLSDSAWKFIFDGQRWQAKDNLGNTYYFGLDNYLNDLSCTKDPGNPGNIFRWRLSKITDASGNSIIFKYFADKIEIFYTEKADNYKGSFRKEDYNYLVSINFVNGRLDKQFSCRAGFIDDYPQAGTGRISEIKISYREQLIRRYALEYAYSLITGRSTLKKITEYGSDNLTANPPVKFNYSGSKFEYETIKYNQTTTSPWRIRFASIRILPQKKFNLSADGFIDTEKTVIPLDWSTPSNNPAGSDPSGLSWSVNAALNNNLHIGGKNKQAFHTWTYLDITASSDGSRSLEILNSQNCNAEYYLSDGSSQEGPFPLSQPLILNNLQAGKRKIFRLDITGYNLSTVFSFDFRISGLNSPTEKLSSTAIMPEPALSGDFNGDGINDLGRFIDAEEAISVAISSKRDFLQDSSWIKNQIIYTHRALLGDFNGDGKTDVCGTFSNYWGIAYSGGSSFNDYQGPDLYGIENFAGYAGDFNGDGRIDIAQVYSASSEVYAQIAFNEEYFFGFEPAFKFTNLSLGINDTIITGDFNGDGVTDFGIWKPETRTLEIKGYKNSWSASIKINDSRISSVDYRVDFSQDFNFDGKPDLFYYNLKEPSFYVMNLFGSPLIGTPVKLKLNFDPGFSGSTTSNPLQTGDFNGDGVTDFLIYDPLKGTQIAYSNRNDLPDLLTEVDNGWGGLLSFKYTPSSDYNNNDSSGKPGMPFVIPVISETTISDGFRPPEKAAYVYRNGLFDAESREFRGFGYTALIDNDGNLTETYFLQDAELKGKIERQTVSDKEGLLFLEVKNKWDTFSPYDGTYNVFLAESEEYTYGQGGQSPKHKKTVYKYDYYGNQLEIGELGEPDKQGDERTTVTEYSYNKADWLVSLPAHTYVLDANGKKVSEQWFCYDSAEAYTTAPVKGLLTKQIVEVFDPLNNKRDKAVTQYSYDSFGNLNKVIDPLGYSTLVEFDLECHTYPYRVTNALNQAMQYTYNPYTGQILTTTDINNQVSKNIYDALGKLSKVIGPYDTLDNPGVIYDYVISGLPNTIVKRSKTAYETGKPDYLTVYSLYDGLGRLIQTKSPAENASQQVISDSVRYNHRGQVIEKFLPYFDALSAKYSNAALLHPDSKFTYDFDCLGRLTRTTNPGGKYSENIYSSSGAELIDENMHKTNFTQDIYGRISKVEEYNDGKIYATIYEYDVLNNLVKIIDDKQNIFEFSYDSAGRRVKLNDPDMGVWRYEYDLNGNLKKQIDGKGQAIDFEYDALKRVTAKRSKGRTLAEYKYDGPVNEYYAGRLFKVSDTAGAESYTYDKLGRRLKVTRDIGSESFTTAQTYDALGRVIILTYPDNTFIKYEYNPQGIKSIKNITPLAAATYVSNVNYEPSGQIKRIAYGNGAITDYAYYPDSLRLKQILTQVGGKRIHDLNYAFDAVGNINNIADNVNSSTQSFLYDDLNRLIQAQGAYGAANYDYDSTGNILNKETVGYTYDSVKPHSVTSTSDGSVYEYDANGNLTRKTRALPPPRDPAAALPSNNVEIDRKKSLPVISLPQRNYWPPPRLDNSRYQAFNYDVENRLVKIEDTMEQNTPENLLTLHLQFGVNYISLPFAPERKIQEVFAGAQNSREEIAYWDTGEQKYLYNVNDPDFNQIDTLGYVKGYWVYINNPNGLTLNIRGRAPVTHKEELKTGWNAIGCPAEMEVGVEEGLKPLVMGEDYSSVLRYNQDGAWQEYSAVKKQFTQLKPGEGYWIKMLKDTQWEVNNQVVPMRTVTEFSYDTSGNRLRKTVGDYSKLYVGSLFEKESTGATHKHIYLGAARVCTMDTPPKDTSSQGAILQKEVNYYHSDNLGSSNVITDASGKQVQLNEYTPFGDFSPRTPHSSSRIAHYFNGKELDRESGLYYYGARYYSSYLGKFIQPDPLIQDVYDPQNLNHYTYCRNNPLILTDPDGTSWSSTWSGLSNTFSSWGTGISSTWNNFTSWANNNWNSTVNNLNQSWQAFKNSTQNSINNLATNAMQSFSSLGSGISSITNTAMRGVGTWGNTLGTGMNTFGNSLAGISSSLAQTSISAITKGAGTYLGLNNNLSKNGYVDLCVNLGLNYGGTFGAKIAPNGVFVYYGLGTAESIGVSATYNVGNFPSEGMVFNASATGGDIAGFKYNVSYSGNGQSVTIGTGLGLGFGSNIGIVRTVQVFPWVDKKNNRFNGG